MLFKLHSVPGLRAGRLTTETLKPMILADGVAYSTSEVELVVPDDEPQGCAIRAAGFNVHTPISMHLGPGATE